MSSKELPIVECKIIEGYSFRNAIACLRLLFTRIDILFSQDGFEIFQSDISRVGLIRCQFFARYMLDYQLNVYEGEEQMEAFRVSFNAGELLRATKPIGKKDQIALIINSSDKKKLIIRSGLDENASCISVDILEPCSDVEYEEPIFKRSNDNPNVKIRTTDFAKACSTINSTRCEYMQVVSYGKFVDIRGMNANGLMKTQDRFPKVPSQGVGSRVCFIMQDKIKSVKVPMFFVKAMTKLSSLSPQGFVSIIVDDELMEDGNEEGGSEEEENEKQNLTLMKLWCSVGSYGLFTLYLKDNDGVPK
jgi:hypothetical protein